MPWFRVVCCAVLSLTLCSCTSKQPRPVPPVAADIPASVDGQAAAVYGELPGEFVGTWLVILSAKAGPRIQNGWSVFRISRDDSGWRVEQLVGKPALELKVGLDKATVANTKFEPDSQTLTLATQMLDQLSVEPEPFRPEKIVLRGPGYFPTKGAAQTLAKDAKLMLEFVTKGPGTAGGGSSYFAKQVSQDKISGALLLASVGQIQLGVKVPFSTSGEFDMYRLR